MKFLIKIIDKNLFNVFSLIKYTFIDIKLFIVYFFANFNKSIILNDNLHQYQNEVEFLKLNGATKIKSFFKSNIIKKLENDFNNLINDFSNLSPSKLGDNGYTQKYLNKEQFDKGELNYGKIIKHIQIKDPLLRSPSLLKIALNKSFINIAKDYFNTNDIYLIGINYRRSYFNNLPANDTQMYHRDRNSFKILKFFIYLNDVDEDIGPFQYILKSHKNWPLLSNRKYRWNDAYIERYYKKEAIFSATSLLGDIIIADTTGFHKGKNLNKKFRTMITLNYSTHQENGSSLLKVRKLNDYLLKLNKEDKIILKYTSNL